MSFTSEKQAHWRHACIQSHTGFSPMTVQIFPTVHAEASHAHAHPASIIDGTECDPAGATLCDQTAAEHKQAFALCFCYSALALVWTGHRPLQ